MGSYRDLIGKFGIITGAASGIGRATALLLAQEGAVLALADLMEDELQMVAREISALGAHSPKAFNISSGRKRGYPGVWVGNKKIAAEGIAVSQWITMHGMAINVCPEMSHFLSFHVGLMSMG